MEDSIEVHWSYTPTDYFEENIEIDRGNYKLVIDNGSIIAYLSGEIYDINPGIISMISNDIKALLMGVLVVSHKLYTLSNYTMHRRSNDGKDNITLSVASSVQAFIVGAVDLQVKNAKGEIIGDTKAERIKQKKRFGELASKHNKDDIVQSILDSYGRAVNDRENELVHLYEIRDALSTKFSGEKKAISVLGINKKNWKRIGYLANEAPLKEGRHRGFHPGQLRNATQEELEEARSIARLFIEGYFDYLENTAS
jgi:hypothetical protein